MYLIQTVSFSNSFMAIPQHSVVYLWTWFFHEILAQVVSVSFSALLFMATDHWFTVMYWANDVIAIIDVNRTVYPALSQRLWLAITYTLDQSLTICNFRESNFCFVVGIPNGCFHCRLQGMTTHKIYPFVRSMRNVMHWINQGSHITSLNKL